MRHNAPRLRPLTRHPTCFARNKLRSAQIESILFRPMFPPPGRAPTPIRECDSTQRGFQSPLGSTSVCTTAARPNENADSSAWQSHRSVSFSGFRNASLTRHEALYPGRAGLREARVHTIISPLPAIRYGGKLNFQSTPLTFSALQ